ncbi:hypothetical protein PR002_g29264 [Phytophthora rubi]|uniref:Uncharacterized protein n=1 Tax=Phytophthora rubi TaxID=129364 RepID=A0A6A3H350_9STRA|nr:hypothetical protein PR002_g29264 [Phytophthora rubi]
MAERPTRTVRFEDEPTVLGVGEVLQHMTADAAERDNRRATVYVATVRPTLASMKYAGEAREEQLRERRAEGAGTRLAGEGEDVCRAGEGAAAPPAEVGDRGLQGTATTNPTDDEGQRMVTLTAETTETVELENEATEPSPVEDGEDSCVTSATMVSSDDAENDDAATQAKQDEISQTRLA